MNSNGHGLNQKVVDLVEIYNFDVEFTSIRIYMKVLWFFEDILSREKISSNFISNYTVDYIKMISNDKSMNYKVVCLNES
jgi:hypothetical protein